MDSICKKRKNMRKKEKTACFFVSNMIKYFPIFRAQVAFPLRESADYAIIGLPLKIACFGGNLRKP